MGHLRLRGEGTGLKNSLVSSCVAHLFAEALHRTVEAHRDGTVRATQDSSDICVRELLPQRKANHFTVAFPQLPEGIDNFLVPFLTHHRSFGRDLGFRSLVADSVRETPKSRSATSLVAKDLSRNAVEPRKRLVATGYVIDTPPRNEIHIGCCILCILDTRASQAVREHILIGGVVDHSEPCICTRFHHGWTPMTPTPSMSGNEAMQQEEVSVASRPFVDMS